MDFDRDGCGVLDDQLDNLINSNTNVNLMIAQMHNNIIYSQPHSIPNQLIRMKAQ